MRIHITGTVWHGNIAPFLGEGFTKLCHEVHFFNESGGRKQSLVKKIISTVSRSPYRVDDWLRRRIGAAWLRSLVAFRPDVIVVEYSPTLLPEDIEKARAFGKPIIYWVTSPPAAPQSKEIFLAVRHADTVLCIDRAWMPLLDRFLPESKPSIHFPLAGSLDAFGTEGDAEENPCDIFFAGSFSPQNSSAAWRAYALNAVSESYALSVFGNGLEYWASRFPRLASAARGGVLPARRLASAYRSAKIVLNMHSVDHLTSISARTFEIALAGGFQIVDYREDLDWLLGEYAPPSFRSIAEMHEKIAYWINRPEEREREVRRMREYVEKNHTWVRRAAEMLAFTR